MELLHQLGNVYELKRPGRECEEHKYGDNRTYDTAADESKPQDPKNTDPSQQSASDSVAETNSGASAAASDKSKFGEFKTSTSAKLLGGGAAAVGVLCIVKSINNDADQIKQTQVILPLIRLGIETMAVGSQVQSGQDIDLTEMGQLSKFLSGTDTTGNKSNWSDAESIQAELGHPNTGVAPSKTLTTINAAAPFGFINEGLLGSILGPACSVGGGILLGGLTLAMDFTGVGALVVNLTGQAAGLIFTGPIIDQIAHWLAGNAVDPEAVGADYGNEVNYGSKLAANDQAVTSGGRELTNNEVYALKNTTSQQDEQQFKNRSIAYKLFNPYDVNTAVSKLIDRTSPSISQNIASIGGSLLNIKHVFSTFSSIFTPHSQAATAGYDYGFPTYGFSEAEMESSTANEVPYRNADEVGALLDKNGQAGVPDYISKARDCFNVNLVQVDDGQGKGNLLWDVQEGPAEAPNFLKLDKSCADSSDPNWLKIRLFIMDSESMNSMSCYQGDGQACIDIGFANEASASQ